MKIPFRQQPLVLLIEDSMHDFAAIQRAFRKVGFEGHVEHCQKGETALDYLEQAKAEKETKNSSLPCFILLDLNLPGIDGIQVLQSIKTDNTLKQIPIIVFTTSQNPQDIKICYQSGVNSYVTKPMDLAAFNHAIATISEYWLKTVYLP
ncbi:response regulator [Spartinivicinus marinus]|nr:response regulator [Spartinivicinus marinus]